LTYKVVSVPDLSDEETGEMLELFRSHFSVGDPAAFLVDLGRKQFAIRLLDPGERLIGFSTITSYTTRLKGKDLGVIYSGDTIIRPEHWGTSVLPRAWLRVVLEMAAGLPKPLYWLLLSSGYKTYRLLPVFFQRFFPRFDEETTREIEALLNHLATELAGTQFHPSDGVIRFQHGASPLRPGVADPAEWRRGDPHTAFFLDRNPGHTNGDELVCLAEICDDNLTRGGRRILRALGKERME
jgi:hypothetical protein